ncbi:ergothioneine biosynthesis protein EgtB [Catenovulum sediminis]|uniref:ergothioneine biosynthesis protein EgtB n=1 Tax=Catenovulum sediminis TaxID=1740262 RepID=UPI0011802AE9|nr:ergothioneine biosynthesis protein EgtB [Catenovulum sediminis]
MMLLDAYLQTRRVSELLCEPLEVEDFVPQAVEFASPPKWHLAHVTWFFETFILKEYLPGYREFDPQFSFLFNSYYQSIGRRAIRNQRGIYSRPTVKQVYQYRHCVDEHMKKLLSPSQLSKNINQQVKDLITLGIHHEQQHQELLLTDLKYTFGLNELHPVYQADFNLIKDHNNASGWLKIDENLYAVGHQGEGFCFDNELGRHQVYLPSFDINKALVTNGEYIEFIEQQGYQNFSYWLDDGWSWLQKQKISSPLYWHKVNGEWFYYTLAGLKPVDPEAMLCHVSYYEAQAYANWKGMRLPTEFEWEVASQQLAWGKRWEWTSSAYLPYPNFATKAGAVGEYNGKFMANQMVLRGASVATSSGHARCTYRNFFYPHMQWQFSGIRLAK